MKQIFIDGEAGTTGLGIRQRLEGMAGITLRSLPSELRKDDAAKAALMSEVDLVILCLPDEAAKATVALADRLGEKAPKILDASTAHRVAPGWAFGFAELAKDQADKIAGASRVSNPGCYATGAIALLRPLVDAGLIPADFHVSINAVSGYTGGGKSMIADYEAHRAPNFELYGLNFNHKHIPEIQVHSNLRQRVIFVPSVGNFAQGMLVSIPLFLDTLPGKPSVADLESALVAHYAGSEFVSVVFAEGVSRLEPESLNDTNQMELRVFADHDQAVLVAKLDNLGKGASGAAVQNLKLMLGL
jgi:N-acetyl-gamma-glutamyl-phosphate reductase